MASDDASETPFAIQLGNDSIQLDLLDLFILRYGLDQALGDPYAVVTRARNRVPITKDHVRERAAALLAWLAVTIDRVAPLKK